MGRRREPEFFTDLTLMGQFFTDLAQMEQERVLEQQRLERYWARRKANAQKAHRIRNRIKFVECFDLWKATSHIEPDFFGNAICRHDAVKKLYEKQHRILWVLRALYHYWMFDVPYKGSIPRKGLKYSTQRKVYFRLMLDHHENIKQKRWDEKRAKVRARREKKKQREKENAKRDALMQMQQLRGHSAGRESAE